MALARILTAKGVQAARVDLQQGNATHATPLDLKAAGIQTLSELISHPELVALANQLPADGPAIRLDQVNWLPPIDDQEVWAAGVTYKRSQTRRGWRRATRQPAATIESTRPPAPRFFSKRLQGAAADISGCSGFEKTRTGMCLNQS